MKHLRAVLFLTVSTLLACCVIYPSALLGIGRLFTPHTASGRILYDRGQAVGSEIIAQNFTRNEYFWPRPSAVDYNAAGSGGSNLSPTNPELRKRVQAAIVKYGATATNPLPADLATASGSGLDPEISLAAAKYQAARVATARHLPTAIVSALIDRHTNGNGELWRPSPSVNVLKLNLELDRLTGGGVK